MKKHLLILTALVMSMSLFTACSEDDNDNNNDVQLPVNGSNVSNVSNGSNGSNGIYVVNSGNINNGIEGSLTYYDYTTASATQNAFKAVNGRSLGSTPNDAIVYGTKLYIVVDGENRIEVADAKTLKSIAAISTTDLLGAEDGKSPRHILGENGYVYVTTYGGCVAAIDTVNYALKKTYVVGSYPEGLTCANGKIYVANSDYGMGANASISVIDIKNGSVETTSYDAIKNPSTLAYVNGALYVVDGDVYDWKTWAVISSGGLRKIQGDNAETVVTAAVAMGSNQLAVSGKNIYCIKDAYTAPVGVVYNTATNETTTLALPDLVAANAIAIDPITGNLVVLSYSKNSEISEYTAADYNAPGYANIYNTQGEKLATFATSVGPTAICIFQGVKYE